MGPGVGVGVGVGRFSSWCVLIHALLLVFRVSRSVCNGSCSRGQSLGVVCLFLVVQKCSILGLGQLLGSVFRCGLKGRGGNWMEGKWS